MDLMELAQALVSHALGHYEDGGWDVIVECWSLEEVADRLREEGATTLSQAIDAFQPLIDVWADRQADADSYRERIDPYINEWRLEV